LDGKSRLEFYVLCPVSLTISLFSRASNDTQEARNMKLNPLATYLLSIALAGLFCAQGTAASSVKSSLCPHSHLKQMAREARTQEQYNALAGCYQKLQRYYLQKAAEEKQEWARVSQNITTSAARYPRPVDSARNFYEYNLSKAYEAGELSAKYSQLAAQMTTAKAQ
jgi:hypothetical protein